MGTQDEMKGSCSPAARDKRGTRTGEQDGSHFHGLPRRARARTVPRGRAHGGVGGCRGRCYCRHGRGRGGLMRGSWTSWTRLGGGRPDTYSAYTICVLARPYVVNRRRPPAGHPTSDMMILLARDANEDSCYAIRDSDCERECLD